MCWYSRNANYNAEWIRSGLGAAGWKGGHGRNANYNAEWIRSKNTLELSSINLIVAMLTIMQSGLEV